MTNENELPIWVVDSQEYLENIKPKIDAIKREGQAEIKRGLEKVTEADKLQKEADYLARMLSRQHDPICWADEVITISGGQLVNRLQSFDEQLDNIYTCTMMGGELGEENHRLFMSGVSDTDSSVGTAVYLGASMEVRFQAIEPSYEPVLVNFEPERLTSHDTLFNNLKTTIGIFGQEYIEMLDGSEAALGSTNPDSLSQAAHSMRDCFQQLIEQLAPSQVVKTQSWFEPTEGAPRGISRRSRLRYMLYGSGENIGIGTIQDLDNLADIAKSSLDLCIARAHEHDPSLTKNEILLAIDQARNALLHVLNVYNELR